KSMRSNFIHEAEPSINNWLPPSGVPARARWGGIPLKAESRPPPHLRSIFILASAARTQEGCAREVFTGLRDLKVPARLIQLVTPPKYWKPMTHWSYSRSY